MNETRSVDTQKLVYLEKETQLDVLEARKGYFRAWDHSLMQETYPFTVKPRGKARDRWDFLHLGVAVPGPDEPPEILATPKPQNRCRLTGDHRIDGRMVWHSKLSRDNAQTALADFIPSGTRCNSTLRAPFESFDPMPCKMDVQRKTDRF
jgi:hypothetical protein